MKVILLERLEGWGTLGDVVNVKDGYARNFLLPRQKALRANAANLKVFEAQRAEIEASIGQRRASEADLQAARLLLSSQVARQYVQVGRLQAQRDVAMRTLAQREEVLALIRQRVEAGLDTQVELRQGQGAVPDTRQQIAALERSVEVSRDDVADLERQRDRWTDPAYITTQARERLYYVRPGEVVYLVDNDLPPELVLALFVAVFLLIVRIVHSPYGQVLKAIRENEPRAVSLGYNVDRYKLLAFVLSTAIAGLAGGLKTLVLGFATLSDVHWSLSGEVVLMTLLGGMGTFAGPVVGAFTIVGLQNYLADRVGSWVTVIIGAIFVICVLAFRRGFVGELLAWQQRRRAG